MKPVAPKPSHSAKQELIDPQGRWHAAACSNVGKVRTSNEDSWGAQASRGAFVVCDGMGGAAAGEVASCLAVEAFLLASAGRHSPEAARVAVRAAHESVQVAVKADESRRGMGTTLVAVLLDSGAAHALVVHAGDSRCYRFRDNKMERMTQDHSLVEEQVRRGQMTAEDAMRSPLRNVITRAVGSSAEASEPEVQRVEVNAGDVLLLCSDGLTRELSDKHICEVLRAGRDVADTSRDLVDAAVEAGGRDNVTALLVRIGA